MSNPNFMIRSATRFDYKLIRYGLKKYYWPLDPMSTVWKGQKTPSFLEFKWTMTNVMDGLNTIAFDPDHCYNFIGFMVNNRWSRSRTLDTLKVAHDSKDQRLFAVIGLQKLAEDETDMYKRYNVEEIFSVGNLGVHRDYYGKSLGFQMLTHSLSRAKRIGFDLAVVNATNEYSRHICDRCEMEEIAKIKYSRIKDEEDVKNSGIFNATMSDKEVSVYVKYFRKAD